MRAYKYVDIEHAENLARGILKIGSFSSFSKLEGHRVDSLEGTVERNIEYMNINSDDNNREKFNILMQLGFTDSSIFGKKIENMTISNFSSISRIADQYCFCMSSKKENEYLCSEKPQAIFEITGVHCLAAEIAKHGTLFTGRWSARRVSYFDRRKNIANLEDMKNFYPDPFIKDCSFSAENEKRIIWEPSSSSEYLDAFLTNENPQIGQLLRRVG
jgi:hypothetical protein